MSTVTIGLDIAKSVFQVHGISATGEVLIRRQVRRGQVLRFFAGLPPCLIGIEACASAHHWSRELQSLGHQVKLMPPAYVKPYVKRQKNGHRQVNELSSRSPTRSIDHKPVAMPVTSAQALKAWVRDVRSSAALVLAGRRKRFAT
jgi:transposase